MIREPPFLCLALLILVILPLVAGLVESALPKPNDTPEKATVIALGDSLASRVWPAGDEDYCQPRVRPL